MRIGIYGGTFNPVHKGHIHFANKALEMLELDKVILVVNYMPPHKSGNEVISGEHRFVMCKLATEDYPHIEVSDIELVRGGKSYMIDTVRELAKCYQDDQLFLLMGTDMFCTFSEWKEYKELAKLACPVGAPREESHLSRLLKQKERLFDVDKIESIVLTLEPIPVSSTDIRQGNDQELPAKVEKYIEQNGLYGVEEKISVDLDKISELLKGTLSRKRYDHSLAVANTALRLAEVYNENSHSCYIAGLLHDICKELEKQEMLEIIKTENPFIENNEFFMKSAKTWHGHAAAIYIKNELEIYNTQILNAIRYHSTARENMSMVEKIIYMADLVSSDREYPGVEGLRQKCYQNIDGACLEALSFIIATLVKNEKVVVEDTVKAYNFLACRRLA